MEPPPYFLIFRIFFGSIFVKENKVEIAILETGLGGRLDSVTACQNNILGFTNISRDHESILGETLKKIAKEKAQAIINCKQKIFSVKQNTIIIS